MIRKVCTVAGALLVAATSAQAQVAPTNFDQAAYVTCREAHAMQPDVRRQLELYPACPPRGVVAS